MSRPLEEIVVTVGRTPRVLVDATSVPADRGGVGRYVDGLLGALARRDDVDLAVVCLRTDNERYERLLPNAKVVAAPTAVSHRPARLASPGSRPGCRCWPSRSAHGCSTRRSIPARCGRDVR